MKVPSEEFWLPVAFLLGKEGTYAGLIPEDPKGVKIGLIVDKMLETGPTPDEYAPQLGRSYNLEFCVVGGTRWEILDATIDEITGWEMLTIFTMSTLEIQAMKCVTWAVNETGRGKSEAINSLLRGGL